MLSSLISRCFFPTISVTFSLFSDFIIHAKLCQSTCLSFSILPMFLLPNSLRLSKKPIRRKPLKGEENFFLPPLFLLQIYVKIKSDLSLFFNFSGYFLSFWKQRNKQRQPKRASLQPSLRRRNCPSSRCNRCRRRSSRDYRDCREFPDL